MAAHRSVAWSVAFVCGSDPQTVSPLFHHVEALGVPDMRLQPNVLPLAPVELQQQVPVATASFAALALHRFFSLLQASQEVLLLLKGNIQRE